MNKTNDQNNNNGIFLGDSLSPFSLTSYTFLQRTLNKKDYRYKTPSKKINHLFEKFIG